MAAVTTFEYVKCLRTFYASATAVVARFAPLQQPVHIAAYFFCSCALCASSVADVVGAGAWWLLTVKFIVARRRLRRRRPSLPSHKYYMLSGMLYMLAFAYIFVDTRMRSETHNILYDAYTGGSASCAFRHDSQTLRARMLLQVE